MSNFIPWIICNPDYNQIADHWVTLGPWRPKEKGYVSAIKLPILIKWEPALAETGLVYPEAVLEFQSPVTAANDFRTSWHFKLYCFRTFVSRSRWIGPKLQNWITHGSLTIVWFKQAHPWITNNRTDHMDMRPARLWVSGYPTWQNG